MIYEDIEKPYTHYFIAFSGGEAAGFIGASLTIDTADITNVAVLPAFRRRGIARTLLLSMETRLKEKGAREIFLEVRRSADAAVSLYKSAGFEEISVRRGYYREPREDALIMRREIF